MKEYASELIRNIAVVSHDGAGKTAVVEAMLLACGAVDSIGQGQNNKHIMDFDSEEIARNVTIQLGIAPCEWNGHKINFIDTPGYSEFHGDVRAALRAADGMLMVLASTTGVEVDTVRAWEYGVEMNLPRIAFINKLDLEQSDFFGTLEKMRELFGKSIMPLQVPINEGPNFKGFIDVTHMKAYEYVNGKPSEIEIPTDLRAKAEEIREMTMEAAAMGNDELLEKYFEIGELTIDEIRQGLREGMMAGNVCPVMCGSAINNIGVDKVLDRMIRYMPSAGDKVVEATTANDEVEIVTADKPFTGLVFKTSIDPFAGKLSYIRIFSGELQEGDEIYNANQEQTEKWGKMYTLIGKEQIYVPAAKAGDIVVIPKLGDAKTGDTITSPNYFVKFQPIRFPSPLYRIAMVPEKEGEEEKLAAGLYRVAEEDPTCIVEKDSEGSQLVVNCMGEIHLEHIRHELKEKFGVTFKLEKPYIPYRETIRAATEVEGKYKKQSGGHGQFGHVKLKIEPLEGADFEFVDDIFGGAVPRQYIPAVEKGAIETLAKGMIAGYPMIGIKVTLQDGSYHSVDSSEFAFKVAAAQALRDGMDTANPAILEPVYNVNVYIPDEFMGDIMGDLSSRRGRVLGMEQTERAGITVVKAQVPLAELDGYVTVLRSLTSGKGVYNMEFFQYELMPDRLAEAIIAERNK